MPKLFPLNVQVEEVAVGRVMRMLNKMPGVAKVGIEMKESKPKPRKANGGPFEASGQDAILELLYKDGPMQTSALREAFAKQGRSPHSIASCIHNLKTAKDILLSDEGYKLSKLARQRVHRHLKGRTDR